MKINDGKLATKLYRQINPFNEQRHLYSIRTAFISTMPIMILGAYAIIINQLPINAYQAFMSNMFSENWRSFGSLTFNSTTQISTLMIVFLTCSNLANWYRTNRSIQVHPGICSIIGLSCYMIFSLPIAGANSLPFTIVGVNGLFIGLIVAITSTESIIRISNKQDNIKYLSNDPNMTVPQSFSSIMPAFIVIGGFLLVRTIFLILGLSDGLSNIINNLLYSSYRYSKNSLITAVRYNISTHLMWLLGIHGNNVLDGVAQTIFVSQNTHITKTLFDVFVYMGGCGTTLGLLISLYIFGHKGNNRILLRYSLPNAIFNINEPLVFGIPIVLNPFYAIPFVLTPVLMLFTTVSAMSIGIVPYTITEVSWATPIFISGYIATGSISGSTLQLANLILSVLIYTPFVLLSEKMSDLRFKQSYKKLLDVLFHSSSPPCEKLIYRTDTTGAVARQLANQIDAAIDNNEMFLNYQPIINSNSNNVYSIEALLRWDHPHHGLINPMLIIALAEETNIISKLGFWIIEEAIAQRSQWNYDAIQDFHISVNISTMQLNNPTFHKEVLSILDKYDVTSNQLQIEITETTALQENSITNKNLWNLSKAGVTIAMDDFGVGHSSLLYLRTQPISTLKIDGSLSRDITKHSSNLDIISTIYDLCNILNVNTIVEYVSSKEQLDLLADIGIYLIQGYFYSPPLPASDVPTFIEQLNTIKQN